MEGEVQFLGVLENVDSSILNVDFGKGFKVEMMSRGQALAALPPGYGASRSGRSDILTPRPFQGASTDLYVIRKTFESWATTIADVPGAVVDDPAYDDTFLVTNYLMPRIEVMRLFKEGYVRLGPYVIWETGEDGKVEQEAYSSDYEGRAVGPWRSKEVYSIKKEDVDGLQRFLGEVQVPFREEYLRLAHWNFESSYTDRRDAQAFLSLMLGMEALFNPGQGEVSYRISWSCAALLTNDKGQFEAVYRQAKKLYSKRSKLVHTGKLGVVSHEDVLELRGLVRRSIVGCYRTGLDKKDLMRELHAGGFPRASRRHGGERKELRAREV